MAGLTVVGSELYGTTSVYGPDGDNGGGGIFSINPDGSDFDVLYSFYGHDGGEGGGLTLDGSALYGAACGYGAGLVDAGYIYSVNTDGSDFTTVHAFDYADGYYPETEDLAIVGSTLFGTTMLDDSGGDHSGTVFEVNTDGTDFQTLHGFSSTDGSLLYAGVTVLGTSLYGTTEGGGSDGDGTIYEISGAVPYFNLTGSGSNATYTAGGSAVDVDPEITVSSSDADLTGATIAISSGTLQSGDSLSFTSQNNITGTYASGTLTLSGTASVAYYQAALQSVTFSNSNTTNPSTTARLVAVQGDDSAGSLTVSNPVTETVDVNIPAPTVTTTRNSGSVHGRGQRSDGRRRHHGRFRRHQSYDRSHGGADQCPKRRYAQLH